VSEPVPGGGGIAPVTVLVSRRALPGREDDLLAELRRAVEVAATFPGHEGAEVHLPAPPHQPEHVVTFRFTDAGRLQAWDRSPERAEIVRRLDDLTEGPPRRQAVAGLDAWLAPPGATVVAVPPKWRTALLTGGAIYVLILGVNLSLGPLLGRLPLPLRTLVTVALLVSLMTWVVMPVLTRLLNALAGRGGRRPLTR
jgi:hypothetical protein